MMDKPADRLPLWTRRVGFLLLALAAPARGQTLVGSVVDAGTGQPLVGVFVQLETPGGVRVAAALSNPSGEFILRADSAGPHQVVAELIGFATARTPVDLERGETVRITIELSVQAVDLGGIRAEVDERCQRRPGSSLATARVWEEARKALEVARWAEQQQTLRFLVVEHERILDAGSLRVLDSSERGRRTYAAESPYQSIAAERLDRLGYVQKEPDEEWSFFAPDAEVLLSESFLDNHCFRLVPSREAEPGRVGLSIEPIPERTLPDIEGVLWIDEGTAEVRRLDFDYVNLPFAQSRWPQVGGRVEFERLATGIWVVRRWYLRMPQRAELRRDGSLELLTLMEQGAEIRSVRLGGRILARDTGATVYGQARAGNGEPLSGAEVAIEAANARARSGSDGAYRLRGIPPGTWEVTLTHPGITQVGLPPVRQSVLLDTGAAARLDFQIGRDVEWARTICADLGWPSEDGPPVVLHGRVVAGPDGQPVPGAIVRVRTDDEERPVTADSVGAYRLCLEPTDREVRVAAFLDGTGDPIQATGTVVELEEPGFVHLDVVIPQR